MIFICFGYFIFIYSCFHLLVQVLRDIANLHATYLGRIDRLDGTKIKPLLSDLSAVIAGGKKLWKAGLTVASRQHPDIVTPPRAKLLHSIIDNLASEISPYLSQFPQTVVHGDLHAGKQFVYLVCNAM